MSKYSHKFRPYRIRLVERDGINVHCFYCGFDLVTNNREAKNYASLTCIKDCAKGEQIPLDDLVWTCHGCSKNPHHLLRSNHAEEFKILSHLPKSERALAILKLRPVSLHPFRYAMRHPNPIGILAAFEILSDLVLQGRVHRKGRLYCFTAHEL